MAAAKKAAAPKASSLSAFRQGLEKRYGSAVVRRETVKLKHEVISTGSMSLDLAHRTGGWAEGRIHQIVGPPGVGKTTLAICSLIEAQRKYPERAVAYIDMEQTFDYAWAEALGLETGDDRFVHIYPDDAEDVSDMLRRFAESAFFPMIVVDSIGGMESAKAFNKEAAEAVMGNNAQIITRMVKHCAVLCRKYNVTVVLVNQHRANLSNPQGQDQAAGPKALKYATSTEVDMRSASGDDAIIKYKIPGDADDTIIGRKIRARVVRSKVAVQGKSGEFYIFNYPTPEYGPIGIDQADEGVTIGVFTEFFDRRGSWYDFHNRGGELVSHNGRNALLAHLRSAPDDLSWVREKSIERLSHEVLPETEVEISMEAGDE